MASTHNFPKLHNAMWPGLVGKGADSEPEIGLDVLIDLTANAEVNGVKFDGIDIFHVVPHTNIDFTEDEVKSLADKVRQKNLNIGSIVAPVWPPVGGGSAMGSSADRKKFVANVEKSCKLGKRLRDLGVRHHGVVRIDSAASPSEWMKDPVGNTKKIAKTFREACSVASDYGERLAAEGEICWGGMHSWKDMINTLEEVDRPQTIGFQADMAHGGIDKVSGMTETFIKERHHNVTGKTEKVGIDDASLFLARFSNGSLANFEATRYARGHKALYTFEINGEHASIAWDLHDLHRLQYFDHRDEGRQRGWRSLHITDSDHPYMRSWWVPGLQIGYEHSFIHQAADFLAGLANGKPAAPTFKDALQTDLVTDAVLKSARTGRWENVA